MEKCILTVLLAVSAANAATERLNFHKGSLNEINVTMKTETKNDEAAVAT